MEAAHPVGVCDRLHSQDRGRKPVGKSRFLGECVELLERSSHEIDDTGVYFVLVPGQVGEVLALLEV